MKTVGAFALVNPQRAIKCTKHSALKIIESWISSAQGCKIHFVLTQPVNGLQIFLIRMNTTRFERLNLLMIKEFRFNQRPSQTPAFDKQLMKIKNADIDLLSFPAFFLQYPNKTWNSAERSINIPVG
ncbi:hypothetical protein AXF13_09405 [Desulfovibrio fairfieldensis]|uniref:Uncharacterized protein n=1 Tax=Desulfovibrio fairfieldensis TaxID=44742 RepID=A0A120KN80_9BACT|nr:hypothetical protein AXF13_09405 [Desulfovibrio fairfieldensis]